MTEIERLLDIEGRLAEKISRLEALTASLSGLIVKLISEGPKSAPAEKPIAPSLPDFYPDVRPLPEPVMPVWHPTHPTPVAPFMPNFSPAWPSFPTSPFHSPPFHSPPVPRTGDPFHFDIRTTCDSSD